MRHVALAAAALLLAPSATTAADAIARFRIDVDPTLSQVAIVPQDGARTDPATFAKASADIDTLVLLNYTRHGLRCVAALAGAVGANAIYVDPMTSAPKDVPASREKLAAACEVPPDQRRPSLKKGQYYVTGANGAYAIEGQVEMSAQRLAGHLKSLDANAIVVIVRPTMGSLECFGAIAEEAGARLMHLDAQGRPGRLKLDRKPSMVEDCAR
ncbi:MAG TPA: hypothetical protein VFO79_08990 [Xanthomonadales bacterium]|nr:hypothetical protein [Xanthomonadales bacterium]